MPISGRSSHACNKCVSQPMLMFLGLRILYWKYAQKADNIKILNFTICHADDIMPTFKQMIAAVLFELLMY